MFFLQIGVLCPVTKLSCGSQLFIHVTQASIFWLFFCFVSVVHIYRHRELWFYQQLVSEQLSYEPLKLILSKTLALYKSFTYLLTNLLKFRPTRRKLSRDPFCMNSVTMMIG